MLKEPFTFEFLNGSNSSTRVLRLTGPFVLQSIFDFQKELAKEDSPVTIFDLSRVPYMDSAGIGVIANYYVSATRRGQKMFVAGTSLRVLELFKLTRVDTVIPMTASVEEAEALA
jgi:anti-sigma B factor antagonist